VDVDGSEKGSDGGDCINGSCLVRLFFGEDVDGMDHAGCGGVGDVYGPREMRRMAWQIVGWKRPPLVE
jgi:hypothetical protein